MSDFRKLSLAFAAVTLMAGLASAQTTPPIVCSTTAQPLTVRTEGLTEQTGDVVISCTGGVVPAPGAVLPQVNISVTLSTNITSRLLNDPISEALLFIDDPQAGAQNPCAPASGSTVCTPLTAGAGGSALDSGGVNRNVFQGVRQNDNTMVWLAVPINAPGTQATRTFRTKNVRAAVAGATATNGQIFAFVSIQNPPANLQLNQATATVAFVQQGLAFAVRSRSGGSFSSTGTGAFLFACDRFNSDLAVDPTDGDYAQGGFPGGRSFSLRYREGYAGSWKQRDVNAPLAEPGLNQSDPRSNSGVDPAVFGTSNTPATESGFFNTAFTTTNGLNRAGRADTGTRLQVRFSGVPANVRVYVSTGALCNTAFVETSNKNSCGGETTNGVAAYGVVNSVGLPATVVVTPSSTAETGGLGGNLSRYPSGATQGLVEVPIASGAGIFVWEVFGADPNGIDTASFAVALAFRASQNPGTGTMNVNGSFSPISTVNTQSASAPIPRFQDQSTATAAASLNTCQTNLLFPFVSNQAGFDTGAAIANTTADPYGTSPQTGNCQLNYYGGTTGGGAAPAAQTTTTPLQGGQTAVFTLSSGGTNGIAATPGFQGYIIAICNFRYAHGFAFISDLGAQRLSHGYLALVLDPSPRLNIANAESLGM